MAAYVSDRDLALDDDGRFAFVLAATEPTADELAGAPWVPIPEDASGIVVRQYVADRSTEELAGFAIANLDPVGPLALPTDESVGGALTAMGWTVAKLMTLHRTVLPEAVDRPNELVTVEAGALGGEITTPDNLYVLGTWRLGTDEALELTFTPPGTRYWSVTVENIWHECLDTRRRTSSVTNAGADVRPDGTVRVVVSATRPSSADDGTTVWLDNGGRHRGFVVIRWLDHPAAPEVRTSVLPVREA